MLNINRLINAQKKLYKNLQPIHSPALKGLVYFTGRGFFHLLNETNIQPRPLKEQYLKLICLPHVSNVVKEAQLITETRKIHRKINNKVKLGNHFALIHEVEPEIQIRVIIEQIGSGDFKFLSTMPHNKKSKYHLKKQRSAINGA